MNCNEDDSSDEDDDVQGGLSLSAETIAALKDFAVASGIPVLGYNSSFINSDDLAIPPFQSSNFRCDFV